MNRTPGRPARLLAAMIFVVLAIGACSSSPSAVETIRDGANGMGSTVAPTAAPFPADEGMMSGTAGEDGTPAGQAPLDGQKDADYATTASDSSEELLIIRTGSLVLDVDNIATTLAEARGIVAGVGGYVSGSDEANEGERHVAVITYRIPAARWDEALDALRGLATKVVTEQTNAVEVTGQVRDLAAWVANYRAEERSLQAIMEKATKVSDILEIESRLFEVRGQIEQLEAQKNSLEEQAADGTLVVTYQTPVVAVEEVKEGWNFGDEVDRAAAQLVSVGQGLASGLVWFGIVILPVLVVLVIVLAIAWFVLRRIARRFPRPASPTWGPAATAPLWGGAPGTAVVQAPATPPADQSATPTESGASTDESHGA